MQELAKVIARLKTPISMIAAMANDNVIGKAGSMPWRVPGELGYFKACTIGKPIVMGRKTFNSLNKPLVDRANIVLTKKLNLILDEPLPIGTSLHFCTDVVEGLKLADEIAQKSCAGEIMIIGGGSVYSQLMPFASKLYISRIDMQVDGADTFFPSINEDTWEQISSEDKVNFTAQIWQNKHLVNNKDKLFTQSDYNLLDLTAKISEKLDKAIDMVDKIKQDKQELKNQLDENNSKEEVIKMEEQQAEQAQTPSDISQEVAEQPKKMSKIDEILQSWQEKYPNTFFDKEAQPLKIGIHEELLKETEYEEKFVKRALAQYTKRPRYLKSMVEGTPRVDLTGKTEVLVSKEDAEAAQKNLEVIKERNKAKQANKPKAKEKEGKRKPNKGQYNKNKAGVKTNAKGDFKIQPKISTKVKVVKKDNVSDEQRFQNKLQRLLDKNRK